ncbi:hypothetical protein Tco_0228517, partial [Tanacetum coccineum]
LSDCFELKDASACHLKIAAITPPAWKGHLDNQMDLELLDLHDHCYARQAMMDNAVNRRVGEFLQVIETMSGEADVIKAMERSCEEECERLRAKCEASMAEFDQNHAILALREKISSLSAEVKKHKALESKVTSLEADKARLEAVEASLHGEIEELRQDRRDVVLKVVPYAAIELVHSDELGKLVGKLVSSAITYGHCRAYEQVAAMKEPFDLSKVKGYRSSYQKEHTQASNDFATATFPWLDEFLANAAAPIKALLSKKPPILQKPAPSRTLSLHLLPKKLLRPLDATPPFVVCLVVIPPGPKSDPHIKDLFCSEDLGPTPLCAFISEGSCVALSCRQMYCATLTRSEGSCVALSWGLRCQMKCFDLLHYVLKAKRSNEESYREKYCVIFNPLQRSANILSLKCFSSFELIIRGTPILHTTYSNTNFSTCLTLMVVRGLASNNFVECSTAIARNCKPSGAIGSGPMIWIPQWLKRHVLPTAMAPLVPAFLIADCSLHFFAVLNCFCNFPVATQRSHGMKKDLLYRFPRISLYCGAWILIFLASLVSSGNSPLSSINLAPDPSELEALSL